jgi:hypothetical protein
MFMKRTLVLMLLALALPMSVFASNSVDFTNSGGTLSGSATAGLSLSGSTLIAVNGLNGMGLITGDLGTLTLSTAALTSGSLASGGMFDAGGSFVITGNGSSGIPNSVLFTGTFTGPVTWSLVTSANGNNSYTLTGAVSGTWYNGVTVYGATTQLTVSTGTATFSGSADIASGDTNITVSTVPEPGSLALLGTGIIGVLGTWRRKLIGERRVS